MNAPFQIIDGVMHMFGVPQITVKEQKNLIVSALEAHDDEFPSGGPHDSMCKQCGARALPCSPHVEHLCVDCLAQGIVNSRENAKSGMILIKFAPRTATPNRPTVTYEDYPNDRRSVNRLQVKFISESELLIGTARLNYALKRVHDTPAEVARTGAHLKHELFSSWMVIINEVHMRKDAVFMGVFPFTIVGSYVCTNQISLRGCLSFANADDHSCFIADSVPHGYSGWFENKKPGREGAIWTYRFCHACASAYNERRNEPSPDAKIAMARADIREYENMQQVDLIKIVMSLRRELTQSNRQLEDQKKKYDKLKSDSNRMRAFIAQAQALQLPDDD
jgi:hypothetical protein